MIAVSADAAIARRSFRQVCASAPSVWGLVFGVLVAVVGPRLREHVPRRKPSRLQIAATTGTRRRYRRSCSGRSPRSTPSAATRSTSATSRSPRSARSGGCSSPPGCCAARKTRAAGSSPLAGGTTPAHATLATLARARRRGRRRLRRHDGGHAARRPRPRCRLRRRRHACSTGSSIAIAPAVFVGRRRGDVAARRVRGALPRAGHGRVRRQLRRAHDRRLGPATQWLLWATPFGWTERMRPITENNLASARARPIARRRRAGDRRGRSWRARDAGAGVLADRERRAGAALRAALAVRARVPPRAPRARRLARRGCGGRPCRSRDRRQGRDRFGAARR